MERPDNVLAGVAAQREHALNRYQSLVEATSAAVWIRAADGTAPADGPGLSAITGQSAAEQAGWGFLDAVHPAHRDGFARDWRAAATAQPAQVFTRTYRLRTARHGHRWFRTRVYLIDPAPLRTGAGAVAGRRATRVADGVPGPPPNDERFSPAATHPVAACCRTAAPVLVDLLAGPSPPWRSTAEQERWASQIGANSLLLAPVTARGDVVAVLMFVSCRDRPGYTDDDLALVAELAERASVVVDAAVTFQRSRQVSVALQSAMLSDPPVHPGVEIEARYVPAVAELQVGGDWYDAFPLPGGDLAVGVGDVVGHDLRAAATMGQLRSMLRGLAHDGATDGRDATPSAVVGRLDRVACGLAVTPFTTLIYGRISRHGGRTVFRWSNAGHPPPLVVGPGGAPRLLVGADLVLGVRPDHPRHDLEVELPPGLDTAALHRRARRAPPRPRRPRGRRPGRAGRLLRAPAAAGVLRPGGAGQHRRHRRRHRRAGRAGAAVRASA